MGHEYLEQCRGIKANGQRCGSTRYANFARNSHLVTPVRWFCHLHKQQDTQ
jgi:hypothetical protein